MKKLFLLCSLSCALTSTSFGQTLVSGGIYTDAVWTKAKSPYIVTDTVVVFPGVTLTIEPGVVVKFDDAQRLEIREANLIANGTVTDSIVFTSNSSSPAHSSWSEILLNNGVQEDTVVFNFCRIEYAENGIHSSSDNTIMIKNSFFTKNKRGLFTDIWGWDYALIVDSCRFEYNDQYGIDLDETSSYFYITNTTSAHNRWGIHGGRPRGNIFANNKILFNEYGISSTFQSILNCEIAGNSEGIYLSSKIKGCYIHNNSVGIISAYYDSIVHCDIIDNETGILIEQSDNVSVLTRNKIVGNRVGIQIVEKPSGTRKISVITCNKICDNSIFHIKNELSFGSNAIFDMNYWCDEDSALIASKIFDGYDDVKYGLIKFMPVDSTCYKGVTTSIGKVKHQLIGLKLSIYPNPVTGNSILEFNRASGKDYRIVINNAVGQKILDLPNLQQANFVIERSTFREGLYIATIVDNDGNQESLKFLVQ